MKQKKVELCLSISAYRLYTVMPRLVKFVDQLTNWYVRMNRKRLKVIAMYKQNKNDVTEYNIKVISNFIWKGQSRYIPTNNFHYTMIAIL